MYLREMALLQLLVLGTLLFFLIWCRRIIESLRLEKTSKIGKSSRHPNTTTPAEPCPQVPYLHVF